MRWAAAVVAVLVTVGVSGCTDARPSPTLHTATPSAALTGDAAFEAPIVCRAVADYDGVQSAMHDGDLAALHRVAAAAATDDAAGFAEERAHSWPADVQPLLKAYFTKGDEQVQYYRDVAKAASITDAVDIEFPDGTAASTPVFMAIGFPTDYACP